EADEGFAKAEAALAAAPDLSELQAQLDALARDVARDRAAVADARSTHEGLKREAEARTRRLAAIETERASWVKRAANADAQIAALRERRQETAGEHASLSGMPDEIDARRRAL